MSRKPLQNRLENLFKTFEDIEAAQPEHNPAPMQGWYWECSPDGEYLSCSPEVTSYLGLTADVFQGQSISSFQVDPASTAALQAIFQNDSSQTETEVVFLSNDRKPVNARFTVLARIGQNGHAARVQGFVQVLSQPIEEKPREIDSPAPQPAKAAPPKPKPAKKIVTGTLNAGGLAIEGENIRPSSKVWTNAAAQSLTTRQPVTQSLEPGQPSVIAMPLNLRERSGILEIVDDLNGRKWSEEDRQFVQEVANQLALAIENAELYQTVQLELGERTRAEQEIREHYKDLATLNIAGQELSRMTSSQEIFNLVAMIADQLTESDVLRVAQYDVVKRMVAFPIIREQGANNSLEFTQLGNDVAGYLFWTRKPLLIARNLASEFVDKGISLPEKLPASMLAIPMLAGDRPVGAIILEAHTREEAYSNTHIDLLSALSAQATISLENATLFQEIRAALAAIENRERYQANVAQVAATLSKYGSKSLPEVLASLGQAAQSERVFFAEAHTAENGEQYWLVNSEWNSRENTTGTIIELNRRIASAKLSYVRTQLQDAGWLAADTLTLPPPDRDFFTERSTGSILILSVPGQTTLPGFIAFEHSQNKRDWQQDEIRLLQVAADSLSNTMLRENLLKQVQVSLRDTENLYTLSHNLALTSNLDEMLAQVAAGLNSEENSQFNLVIFNYAQDGALQSMAIAASHGAAALPVGHELSLSVYKEAFCRNSNAYFDDLETAGIPDAARQAWLLENNHSAALLPLWTGKRQTGLLYALSSVKNAFSDQFKRYTPAIIDQLATLVENTRLFDETQEALSETGLLYRISDAISQAETPQELARIVAEHLMPTGAERVSLLQVTLSSNGEPSEVEVIGFYDAAGEFQRAGLRIPAANLPLIQTIGSEPVIIQNVKSSHFDPVSRKTLIQLQIQSGCLYPLLSTGSLVGLLLVSSSQITEFKPEEIRRLQVAANSMAVTMEKQNLLREAQRRALELQTAAEIARDTSSTLSLDDLLSRIVPLICERFNYYHASIFLLDADQKFAVVRESTGEAGKDLKARKHKLAVGSRSIIGTVTATGEPLVVNDTNAYANYYPNPLLPETRAEMGIPLKLGSQIIGALDIQSTRANSITDDDVSVLQILSDQIAIAIENARAYEISQQAVEEMREVDRMKSQFLANMSHELRTPLNSIIGFSRVILKGIDGPINETQTQDLSAIYNSGQHLLNLINDILDLSKIEAGKMELSFSEVHIGELADSVMSTGIGLVKGKPVRMEQIIPEGLPSARADGTRVRQVLLNFISNAAKFTDEGSITIEAGVKIGPKGKPELMITVTDTGPGIAPEDTHKLFQPFSQVDDSPTRKTGGTGLGLSICRSLIDMHGGRIGLLRSQVGVGSTFFFTLPLYDESLSHTPPAQHSPRAGTTILAIDDDPQIIGLYERYLKPQGYQVIGLTNPAQAVELARTLQPAAITLDVMMPEKDGWHVMHDLKNMPETRNIPVIFCSIIDQEEKAFSLGAADYLVKPFLQEDLIQAIQRLNPAGKIHRVLVVDDSIDDLRLVQKMLEGNDLQVDLAEGGQRGWEALQAQPPDALVLDLFMPDLNGFEILARLRNDPLLQSLPVIVLTGADLTAEQRVQMIEMGQKYLPKGRLSENELVNAIEQALQAYQLTPTTPPEE